MSLLRNDDVLWYHPLDDFTEFIKDHVWNDAQDNLEFSGSILISGMTPVITGSYARIEESLSAGGYTDIDGATSLTSCFWAKGVFDSFSSLGRNVEIGFENSTVDNTIRLQANNGGAWGFELRLNNTSLAIKNIPTQPVNDDWNFIVLRAEKEGANWRQYASFNGSGWQDLGTVVHDFTAGSNTQTTLQLRNPGTKGIIDEVVFWKDASLFSSEELSNLYELYNTHGVSMDQYSSTYGTPINSGIDCFIEGSIQSSGNISLYIPSQKETSSITLFMSVITPQSGNIDQFIQGHQQSSGNVDQYVEGYQSFSSSGDMYVSGVPFSFASSNLYAQGPLPESGNVNDFIWGHKVSSGNATIFLAGAFPRFDAFVSVARNNPSEELNLFIHGIPLGSPTIFYTNDSATLFIRDLGLDTNVGQSWPSFAKVSTAVVVSGDNTWAVFVRGGNTSNNNISLYTYGHAPGSPPHGTFISGSVPNFINGQSALGGEEGLLSNGYFVDNVEFPVFSKVHFGVVKEFDLYVSGSVLVAPPSSSLSLFIFGILDTTSGSFVSYVFGQDIINDSYNLFILGIQGVEFNNIPLYIEVTDIGLFNQENTLYSHGY